MSLRSRLLLSLLALGLTACDGGDGDDDAGTGDAAAPDAGEPSACSSVTPLMGVLDATVSVTFDTTTTEAPPLDLGSGCGNRAATVQAPQEIVEFTVPGDPSTTYAVEFRSNVLGTDMNFNTLIQVRDACETAPPSQFPPRCFDKITMDELRSEGAVTVAGGTVLYFVITGYSEPPAAQMAVDSGVVQVDFFVREGQAPTITDGFLRLAADDVRVELTGNDPNADVRGVAMNFFAGDELLDIYGDGEATEDVDIIRVRFDEPAATGFDYTGGAWLRAVSTVGPYLRTAGATRVRFRVYDAAWGVSDPFDADITEAVLVGFGEACDREIFCRPEMMCAGGRCQASAQMNALCEAASELPFTSNPAVAETITMLSTTGEGVGLVSIDTMCVSDGDPDGGIGTERVYKVDVALVAFDLLITTDLPGTGMTNTIVYVRGQCADSGTVLACDDDAVAPMGASEIELRDLTTGTYYVFVERSGGLAMGTVPHEIGVTVRPLIAPGGTCDMAGVDNRCRTGSCTAGACAP